MALDSPEPPALNPYAPPKAVVGDPDAAPTTQTTFFQVGCTKLAVMSLATLGLYQIYWFYKNWKSARQLGNEKLNAPLRALFYVLTAYWLFRRIEKHIKPMGIEIPSPPAAIAIVIF